MVTGCLTARLLPSSCADEGSLVAEAFLFLRKESLQHVLEAKADTVQVRLHSNLLNAEACCNAMLHRWFG